MEPKFGRNQKTIRDHISDDILKEFLNQLPWKKDQLIGIEKTYKDIVKLDQITNVRIKIKKGFISGKFFAGVLQELPRFDFDKHHYEFRLSNFTRETIPPKKHIDKWPGFHVRKLLGVAT